MEHVLDCDDLIIRILSLFEPYDLIIIQGVCHRWNRIIRRLISHEYPLLISKSIWSHENFLNRTVETSIYPGMESKLDLLRCLSRCIHRHHLFGFRYFLRQVRWEHLNVEDFASLFDLLALHWNLEMLLLLVQRYRCIHPRYMHRNLLRSLSDFDDEIIEIFCKDDVVIERTPLYDPIGDTSKFTWKQLVLGGRLDWVVGNYVDYSVDEIRMCSQQIRLKIDRYT